MNEKRNKKAPFLMMLSVSLVTAVLTTFFVASYYSHREFRMLGNFCEKVVESHPDTEQTILQILKQQELYDMPLTDKNILLKFGYDPLTFFQIDAKIVLLGAIIFLTGGGLFGYAFRHWNRMRAARIAKLTESLERINTDGQGMLWDTREDELSGLQDEIYKTVTMLFQTRDAALMAKNNYAENLSNIAHQLKTPLTAISLSIQTINEHNLKEHCERMRRQLCRLTKLEEALLLLARIDAGTLTLTRKPADVFTILTLACDHLQELMRQKGILAVVPEMGEVNVVVDLDWTMEAVINLIKDCVEAAPWGTAVHCSYEENPLYVQIRIWDEGEGFTREDLPHLFERFYRGKNVKDTGIGIGLSLAKAIIEMQGGIISAFNLPAGGACFEIRFYTSYGV